MRILSLSWVLLLPPMMVACLADGMLGPFDKGGEGGASVSTTSSAGGDTDPQTSSAESTTTSNGSTSTSGTAMSSSNSAASSSSSSGGNPNGCKNDVTVHHGQATWYELNTPLVNCSYETPTLPAFYGAMNTMDYEASAICGSCLRVKGPKGSVDIQIVDQCPFDTNPICYGGHIDLNPAAFQQIGDLITGIIPISWHRIECPGQKNISYHFKDGSSQFWTAVMVRDHRYPITKVEYKDNGQWKALVRKPYNYFVADQGMGPGPYDIRVTDVYGQVIEDKNIPLQDGGGVVPSNKQFPACTN